MLDSPYQDSRTGLPPPISTSVPGTPPAALRARLRSAYRARTNPQGGSVFDRRQGVNFRPALTGRWGFHGVVSRRNYIFGVRGPRWRQVSMDMDVWILAQGS